MAIKFAFPSLMIIAIMIVGIIPVTVTSQAEETLDPLTIPKWENQITGPPPVYVPRNVTDGTGKVVRQDYFVNVTAFTQQILPPSMGLTTTVWGYGGVAKDAVTGALIGYVRNSPGPTFEAIRNIPVQVTWINNLTDAGGAPLSYMFPVDPTLHWANPNNIPMNMGIVNMEGVPSTPFPPYPPGFDGTQENPAGYFYNAQSPAPIVTHLHGAEVQSSSDGGPDQWWTANGIHGPEYATTVATDPNAAVYLYPNIQEPTTLWYHDHALGVTRINVMSGLAGFYLLRDPADTVASLLPTGKYEIPLAIQDRRFLSDGSLYFPVDPTNPSVHPYWGPEFFGDVIMVNGLVWPNMNVDQALYRFRLLDGSNARFYNISFSNGMPFTQIGTDGGYLQSPATLTSLLISPGERADILVNFSGIAPGTKIILLNDARTPYPDGDPVDPMTTAQIIQFTVNAGVGPAQSTLPTILNPTLTGEFPTLPPTTRQRILTLTEIMGEGGPLEILLDGQKWVSPTSEMPVVGTTEDWVIVNPTADTHPIHLHLVQFQLVQRQAFNATAYYATWLNLNGMPPLMEPTVNVGNLSAYLIGSPMPPAANEQGWKDTIQMNPGEVTTIRIRFTQQNGSQFSFNASTGQGYVWHCHIIDHEDNEMMRRFTVTPDSIPPTIYILTPTNGTTENNPRPTISAAFSDNLSGIDVSSIRISVNGVNVTANASINSSIVMYVPATNLPSGLVTVVVQASDSAGNLQSASSSFVIPTDYTLYIISGVIVIAVLVAIYFIMKGRK